jgi:hypothetical protein
MASNIGNGHEKMGEYWKMQADRKGKFRRSLGWVGFGIGVVVSLLAYFGIAGLLFIIEWSRLPEEELAIFTSLFYGIVFFIALGGVRSESRKYKMLVARRPFEPTSPPTSPARETLRRILTILWYAFSLFSLGWLTPALVIYWADTKHPHLPVSICAFIFSLVAGTAYALRRAKKTGIGNAGYFVLYLGVCLGALLAWRIMVLVEV